MDGWVMRMRDICCEICMWLYLSGRPSVTDMVMWMIDENICMPGRVGSWLATTLPVIYRIILSYIYI